MAGRAVATVATVSNMYMYETEEGYGLAMEPLFAYITLVENTRVPYVTLQVRDPYDFRFDGKFASVDEAFDYLRQERGCSDHARRDPRRCNPAHPGRLWPGAPVCYDYQCWRPPVSEAMSVPAGTVIERVDGRLVPVAGTWQAQPDSRLWVLTWTPNGGEPLATWVLTDKTNKGGAKSCDSVK